MSEVTELKIVTSIYLRASQLAWIRENADSISKFARDAIDEKIQTYTGHELKIDQLNLEIEVLRRKLEEKKIELEQLQGKQTEWIKEKEKENVNDLLVRALINIDYESWEDAAKDLKEARGELSQEEWRSLVERRWKEVRSIE